MVIVGSQFRHSGGLNRNIMQVLTAGMATFGLSSAATTSLPTKNYDQINNTVVTAFFNLGTQRHSLEEYYQMMGRLFSNNDGMIIFTSPDLAQFLGSVRGKEKRTLVVPMRLNETKTSQIFSKEHWIQNITSSSPPPPFRIGSNRGAPIEAHQLWLAKVEFLKYATQLNPFRSTYFAWVDAGMVRDDMYTNGTILERIPNDLPPDKLMLLHITNIIHHKDCSQMGGGIFGGYTPAVDQYYDAYYKTMKSIGTNRQWAPMLTSEQALLYEVCAVYNLCYVVHPMKQNGLEMALQYPMFYMLPFHSQSQFEVLQNNSLVDYNHNGPTCFRPNEETRKCTSTYTMMQCSSTN
jgi:hypothetical protein